LLRLYPRAWRERYGEELSAQLAHRETREKTDSEVDKTSVAHDELPPGDFLFTLGSVNAFGCSPSTH
jgi:hypothetical protein